MTRSQEALLLSTARILLAHLKDALSPAGLSEDETRLDYEDLKEALAPFNPSPAQQSVLDQFKAKEPQSDHPEENGFSNS